MSSQDVALDIMGDVMGAEMSAALDDALASAFQGVDVDALSPDELAALCAEDEGLAAAGVGSAGAAAGTSAGAPVVSAVPAQPVRPPAQPPASAGAPSMEPVPAGAPAAVAGGAPVAEDAAPGGAGAGIKVHYFPISTMDRKFGCQIYQLAGSWFVWVGAADATRTLSSLSAATQPRFATQPSTTNLMAGSDAEADLAGRLVGVTGGQPCFVSHSLGDVPMAVVNGVEAAVVRHLRTLLPAK